MAAVTVTDDRTVVRNPPSTSELFLSFLRLGVTAFGGPSMVAYIRRLAVERKGWLSAREFSEGVAFCQMVPGATAMQTAAYVGLHRGGVAGATASFVGFGLPAFCLMLVLAMLYARTGSLPAVVAVFSGLQAVVVAVVANAAVSFGKTTLKHWLHWLIAISSAALFWMSVNPLVVILLAAAIGWLFLRRPASAAPQPERSAGIPLYKRPLAVMVAVAGIALAAIYWFSPELFRLAVLMAKVDLTAFGGGFASVPIMYREVVEVNGWLAGETFMHGIILGQVTPGPIVITATFIGYMLGRIPGAIIASVGVFLPSLLIVIGVSPFYDRMSASPVFVGIIQGVLCSFVGLLASVALRFGFQIQWDVVHVLLAGGALLALLRRVDILWVVLGGLILSIGLIRA